MAELTPTGLRVLLAVAETGSFTAAARSLGYTQSAVSRQIAAVESAAAQPLFERHRGGARLTAAGARLLPRARRIIDDIDAALADALAAPTGRVRLGAFPIAAASVIPDALARLRDTHPDLVVTVREATTPALVRSLRAGTIDLALVAQSPPYRPLDTESPTLDVVALVERDLVVCVPDCHRLAHRRAIETDELLGEVWVASPTDGDSLLGVWPGLAERPDVRYVVRDWMAKLRIVAAGLAITTVAASLVPHLPTAVTVVSVRGEPSETRRLSVVRLPGPASAPVEVVMDALRQAVTEFG